MLFFLLYTLGFLYCVYLDYRIQTTRFLLLDYTVGNLVFAAFFSTLWPIFMPIIILEHATHKLSNIVIKKAVNNEEN